MSGAKAVRTPVTLVQLTTPDVPENSLIGERSWMLSSATTHFDLRGHFMLASHVRKGASLGTLFADTLGEECGAFQLELGVVLPDLFPNVDGKPEYCLQVSISGASREICFSNVMSRLRYTRDDQPLHAVLPRRAIASVRSGAFDFIPCDASEEHLRTVATCRYPIEGADAEEAFEMHCEQSIADFIERLNQVRKMLPFVDLSAGRTYSVAYSRASLPALYFLLKGTGDAFGHGWISPHVGRATLNPPSLSREAFEELASYLLEKTRPDESQAILHAAQSFADAGVIEYVLLLSVIAAEVATQRYVHKRLLASGVSRGKLKEMGKDLTYSMMLNVVLFAVTDAKNKPASELVGQMNRARTLRNDYMHEGKIPKDHSEVLKMLAETRQYVAYLSEMEKQTPLAC